MIKAQSPNFANEPQTNNPRAFLETQRQRAYLHMNAGDEAMEHNDFAKANREYTAAEELAPHIVEIPFWRAVTLVSSGNVDAALPIFDRVFEREPIWRELVPRLVNSGLLPDDQTMIDRIVKLEPR